MAASGPADGIIAAAEPVPTKTTAVGSLMRRHLEPVLAPILVNLHLLRGLPR